MTEEVITNPIQLSKLWTTVNNFDNRNDLSYMTQKLQQKYQHRKLYIAIVTTDAEEKIDDTGTGINEV